jgi:hypothetical protein
MRRDDLDGEDFILLLPPAPRLRPPVVIPAGGYFQALAKQSHRVIALLRAPA